MVIRIVQEKNCLKTIPVQQQIRSYVRRERYMTKTQQQALADNCSEFCLDLSETTFGWSKIFQRDAPCVLEIGFGRGDALIALAQRYPEQNFIGIDVHRPGVGHVLNMIKKLSLKNIRLFCDDAKNVFNQA